MNNKMTNFLLDATKSLVDSLSVELPDGSDPESLRKLKELVSYAEAQRARLGTLKRRIDVVVEERRLELSEEYDNLNKDKKTTRDQRELYVRAGLAEELSNQKFISELQEIIKTRVSLGQSFLKSLATESESGYVNNNFRLD